MLTVGYDVPRVIHPRHAAPWILAPPTQCTTSPSEVRSVNTVIIPQDGILSSSSPEDIHMSHVPNVDSRLQVLLAPWRLPSGGFDFPALHRMSKLVFMVSFIVLSLFIRWKVRFSRKIILALFIFRLVLVL